jgi:hypothetical protein
MMNPQYIINGRRFRRNYCSEARLERVQELLQKSVEWQQRHCIEVSEFGLVTPSMLKSGVDIKDMKRFQAEQYAAMFEILFTPDDGEPMPPPQFFHSKDFEHEAVHQALSDFFLNMKRMLR